MEELTQNTPHKPVDGKIDKEESKIISLEYINSIPEHIHHLTGRTLNIVRAPKNYFFHCSDNPVVMYNPYSYLKTGLGGVGTEICFPISKELLVNFTCSVTSKKLRTAYQEFLRNNLDIPDDINRLYQGLFEQRILEIEPKYVDFYNLLQVNFSSRFLYSPKNNFEIALKTTEENPELKEVRRTMGLGSRPMPDMPDGDQIAIFLKDGEHNLLSIELLNSEYDLYFKVSQEDNWKIAVLFDAKEPIDYVRVFQKKQEARGMRDVEITSYDSVQRLVVISHRDKGVNEIIKHMRSEKAKRMNNEVR